MRAIRITENNIEMLGLVNNGVVPDPEHCLEEVHYFIEGGDDEYNGILHATPFHDKYQFIGEENEFYLVQIKRRTVAPQITEMLKNVDRSKVAEITNRMVAKGYSVEEIAAQAGLHPSVIRQIQQGKLRPSEEIRARLAKALGIDI
jgi:lambda repressor-like predicted transcriptional regulator